MRVTKIVLAALFLLTIATSCNKYNKIYKSKDYEYKLKMADELFAKKNCVTFEEAIDNACDALKTQIIKHKEKTASVK